MADLFYSVDNKRLQALYENVPVTYRLSDEECAAIEVKESTVSIGGEDWVLKYKPIRNCDGFFSIEEPGKVPFESVTAAVPALLDCVEQLPGNFAVYDPESIELYDVKGHKFLGGKDEAYALKYTRSEQVLTYPEFPDVTVKVMYWALPTLRLKAAEKASLVAIAERIIANWENAEEHRTVTALARKTEEGFDLDLILCGEPAGTSIRATSSILFPKPFGMMGKLGFAILDKNQQADCKAVAAKILARENCADDESISKYAPWQEYIQKSYSVGSCNIEYIMNLEIRGSFIEKLMQMAVYEHTQLGFNKYLTFVEHAADAK